MVSNNSKPPHPLAATHCLIMYFDLGGGGEGLEGGRRVGGGVGEPERRLEGQ
jgi:hypothetical protein